MSEYKGADSEELTLATGEIIDVTEKRVESKNFWLESTSFQKICC